VPNNKLTKEVVVTNQAGIHLRVSRMLSSEASRFHSSVRLHKGNASANVRSMLETLSLGAAPGESLQVEVEGEDEKDVQDALDAVVALFRAKFHEGQAD
jgi:phosphotransferase system HPr (HPr) family protein